MAMRFDMDALRASTAFSPAMGIIIAAMVAPIKRLDELRAATNEILARDFLDAPNKKGSNT